MNEKALGEPLTLEQLREMVGMPVWIERNDPPHDGKWDLVDHADIENTDKTLYTKSGVTYSEYGKYFTAYVSAPPRLDRSAWEPCEHCKPSEYPPDYYGPHNFPLVGAEIYFYDTDDGWEGEEINFCPWCGRPLTDEAVKEFERRVYGG